MRRPVKALPGHRDRDQARLTHSPALLSVQCCAAKASGLGVEFFSTQLAGSRRQRWQVHSRTSVGRRPHGVPRCDATRCERCGATRRAAHDGPPTGRTKTDRLEGRVVPSARPLAAIAAIAGDAPRRKIWPSKIWPSKCPFRGDFRRARKPRPLPPHFQPPLSRGFVSRTLQQWCIFPRRATARPRRPRCRSACPRELTRGKTGGELFTTAPQDASFLHPRHVFLRCDGRTLLPLPSSSYARDQAYHPRIPSPGPFGSPCPPPACCQFPKLTVRWGRRAAATALCSATTDSRATDSPTR
mmetsp:Transcript_43388/g.117599  ORF Transcript_43388/g.117599 Transcript_43388/m.117599 type:complete len:299 (-) Transcript_43388:234-1130(-)